MSKTDNVCGYEDKKAINWYPGHMAKARREIKEKSMLFDIVYEVIDARMPVSSKIEDIDELIKDKKKILVVTKYDLCDKEKTDKILEAYKSDGYFVVPVDLINGNVKSLITLTNTMSVEFNEQRKTKGLKERAARILVVGVPNVGKSTLINKLVGKKAANVGNKPGVTKGIGWIRIKNGMELLDSPGILWPKLANQENALNLACFSSIREEVLDSEQLARYIVCKMIKLYPERILNRYSLESYDEETFFDKVAQKRGLLLKGGKTDYDKVYELLIKDLQAGNFGKITFDEMSENR